MPATITRQELQALTESGHPPTLVEALGEGYYAQGHLPGALNLPHDKVRELAPKLLPDKTAPIVTYCASPTCQNSHIAADALRAMGYGNVSVYAGGKQDWTAAGLPLETGTPAVQAA